MCRLSRFFPGGLITLWCGMTSITLNGCGCQMLQTLNGKIREGGVISFFLSRLAYIDRKKGSTTRYNNIFCNIGSKALCCAIHSKQL